MEQTKGTPPHRAILGCTHFPLVEHLFRRHLPPFTRILSQPEVVADSLEDYLARRPHYLTRCVAALAPGVAAYKLLVVCRSGPALTGQWAPTRVQASSVTAPCP